MLKTIVLSILKRLGSDVLLFILEWLANELLKRPDNDFNPQDKATVASIAKGRKKK